MNKIYADKKGLMKNIKKTVSWADQNLITPDIMRS